MILYELISKYTEFDKMQSFNSQSLEMKLWKALKWISVCIVGYLKTVQVSTTSKLFSVKDIVINKIFTERWSVYFTEGMNVIPYIQIPRKVSHFFTTRN